MSRHRSDFYIPGKTEADLDEMAYGEALTEDTGEHFHIGQCYEEETARKQRCSVCKSDKLEVAIGSHYTAIRCPKCQWEVCIHDG